ncbi:MAG: sigma-70 family RNA polymerase sigma factor [Labilithrix sp.]|nr:sigma-70 family RNA polymerase sigma factor [Labilithrix sp.]
MPLTAPPEGRLLAVLKVHAPALSRLAASYTRSTDEREDLLQDIALALHLALPSFRGDASERTFVLRVAHNRAITFAARRGAAVDIADHEDALVASSGKNPELRFERAERGQRLLAAVRTLPLTHRQVMTMLLEGLAHREIAEVLGVTENVVAVRANRARAALKVLLEGEGS